MPLIATRGAASVQGFGEFAQTTPANYIEDVFQTWIYTGNGSTQTITNGIDLSSKSGLVWIKDRTSATYWNCLYDTIRGATKQIYTNRVDGQDTESTSLTSFNTNGFSLGSYVATNTNNNKYASWTFREQPKFFDVVTFTGIGAAQQINHNLGSTPGCIIVKNISAAQAWYVYHRSLSTPANDYLVLNTTAASATISGLWGTVNSTQFGFLGNNGENYVAYLFAHNAGGFGLAGDQNVISCGSYTGNGSATGPTISLGYEPQWLLIKRATGDTSSWFVFDSMRGMVVGGNDPYLIPNAANAEDNTLDVLSPTATGFQITNSVSGVNANGSTYIYIAIRRGPMKTPTSGTSVFIPVTYTGDGGVDRLITSGFVSDFAYIRDRNDGTEAFRQNFVQDRLRGGGVSLVTNSTGAQGADTGWTNTDMVNQFQSNTGMLVTVFSNRYNASSKSYVSYQFARAPGFMDVVCYTGTGSATTFSHNLGVAPELMIVKRRSGTAVNWAIYSATLGNDKFMEFTTTGSQDNPSGSMWNLTTPTSSVFSLGGSGQTNTSSGTYVAYLFATLAGVSKVGSYTGTGTTLQVNCGFTSGSRFVMIKRTDSTGDWYVWDSARGIVAGNDPYVVWNTSDTEVTNTDYVDTYSAGFEISSTAPAAINANGGTFIFLAIA